MRWTAIRAAKSKTPLDLAIGVLSTPLAGHDFTLSKTSPARGQRVAALGYAAGQPLSFNQGHVTVTRVSDGVRTLVMSLLEAGGASDGPILDADGIVVAVTQYGAIQTQTSVDLAAVSHGDPSQFCLGTAAGQRSTVCPARERPGALAADGPPPLCYGHALAPVSTSRARSAWPAGRSSTATAR